MVSVTRYRRLLKILGVAVSGALLGASIVWAGIVLFSSPREVLKPDPFSYAHVVDGEVGSSLNLSVVAEWAVTPIGTNSAVGTVTSTDVESGAVADQGTVLYSVDLRPVVAAQGDVPMFRDLTIGARGKDVEQLQRMLASLGFYRGHADGEFETLTHRAVEKWQRSRSADPDGTVRRGDVIFVPALPARVSLDHSKVGRGMQLVGGEMVLSGVSMNSSFVLPVTDTQASIIPARSSVVIDSPSGGTWQALVGDRDSSDPDQAKLLLVSTDDEPICGGECSQLSLDRVVLGSRVVTVTPVRALVVPTGALVSRPDGSVEVIDSSGRSHPVHVEASARGMSAITGVPRGMRVRISGGER